jgi:hypothetical protein
MAQVLSFFNPRGHFISGASALVKLSPQYSLPWTPRSITATPLVAWYDPSDITTLFTDTAGTVPVTADGDLVACMKDKSGNGNHATQATSGSRPIYRSGGYLDFDGARFMVTGRFSLQTAAVSTARSGGLFQRCCQLSERPRRRQWRSRQAFAVPSLQPVRPA